MICNYVSKQESPYYQSEIFTQMLQFVQTNKQGVKMYERNNSLRLSIDNIVKVSDAIKYLKSIVGEEIIEA